MPSFVDAKNRSWQLSLTVGDLLKVRAATGVDLGAALKSETALGELLFGDPATLVATLFVLCESQAATQAVTPEEFGYGFDGPTLERATESLIGAVADFFPRSRIGKAIRQNLTRVLDTADAAAVTAITAHAAQLPT